MASSADEVVARGRITEKRSAPEIHVFVLWERARRVEARILADIRARFDVLGAFEVAWPPSDFVRNLTRFYGKSDAVMRRKVNVGGSGPFLVVVVRVESPVYEYSLTTSGTRIVNVPMLEAKRLYRVWSGRRFLVHGTDDPGEVEQHVFLLLGRTVASFAHLPPRSWDGMVARQASDMPGAAGWASLEDMLEALGLAQPYVVMEDPERDASAPPLGGADMEVLVERLDDAVNMLGGSRLEPDEVPIAIEVRVGGRTMRLRMLEVGDGSFDVSWQRDLLARRRCDGAACRLTGEHLPWVRLHRAVVHEPRLLPGVAAYLRDELGSSAQAGDDLSEPDVARRLLIEWMAVRGYAVSTWRSREPLPKRPRKRLRSLVRFVRRWLLASTRS
jgi:hypothetical protein